MSKKFKLRYQKSRYAKDQALSAFFRQGMSPANWQIAERGKWWLFVRRAETSVNGVPR